MSATENSFKIIQAVVSSAPDPMTFTAILEATGLPRASAHRLLKALVGLGALDYDVGTKGYRGGLLLARIGAPVTATFDIRTYARPSLLALAAETGHVATLGVRHADKGVYIDKIEPPGLGLRLHSEVGKDFPLHATAMGKVLLAAADDATRTRVLRGDLVALTANTLTDPAALRDQLTAIADRGYAIDDEEITRGLVCVAAPVLGPDRTVAGAMSCTFPSYIRDEQGMDAEIAAVRTFADRASGNPLV